jgi:ferredoxin
MWKILREKCLRCGACIGVCPNLALELTESGVKIDKSKCKACKICEKTCPVGAIEVK